MSISIRVYSFLLFRMLVPCACSYSATKLLFCDIQNEDEGGFEWETIFNCIS